MNGTVSSEDRTQYEQRALSQLEKDYGTGIAHIGELVPSNVVLPPDKIVAIIDYVTCLERHLISYNPAALYLKNVGRPHLFDKLQQILSDFRQSKTIYVQMHDDALKSQGRIPPQVSMDWLQGAQDALDRQQRAFDQSFRQGQAIFNNTCPYCNYYMGGAYFDVCPQCGRLLRGGYP